MHADELPTPEFWGPGDWCEVLNKPATWYGQNGDAGMITAERIEAVLWLEADSPEGWGSVDMACLVRLTDGAFAMCEAWADTTGWGCRDGVTWKVAPSILLAASELSPDYREKLTEHLMEGS